MSSPISIKVQIEREDLCQGLITGRPTNPIVFSCSKVTIGNYEFWKSFDQQTSFATSTSVVSNWTEQLSFSPTTYGFPFHSEPGSYFVEIACPGFFPERRHIQLKRGEFALNTPLTATTSMKFSIKTCNLITQSIEPGVSITVINSENNEEIFKGTSHPSSGEICFEVPILTKTSIVASKKHHVDVTQQITFTAASLSYDVYVIPLNENAHDRLDILVFEPHRNFNLSYTLTTEETTFQQPPRSISSENPVDSSLGGSYDTLQNPSTGSKLTAISLSYVKG